MPLPWPSVTATSSFRRAHTNADKYPDAEQRYGWGQIALNAARKHDPRALEWFARAGPAGSPAYSDAQARWHARAALLAGKWAELYQTIQAMPDKMQAESVWRYWMARSLKAMNVGFLADAVFAYLSQAPDYYGLLSLEELPSRLESRPTFYHVTPDDLREAEDNPGLQRALLLRKLDLPGNAQEEWNFALREGWHDRAIIAANLTKTEHNFDLRYIAPFRDLASTYAQKNGLDEAWVYGLIRQESRFTTYARSHAGARGLMQIMPSTAKWIARQMGLDHRAHRKVGKPETNLRFGTYYLKRIYDSLDQSAVLATAGYNAGPTRARRWQADTPLEGAVYVECIPFQETREYVKKVMTNAMFYRSRFGGVERSLKDRLGVIPARESEMQNDADQDKSAGNAASATSG
jgi:soluble lytic murein transglycosylase